MVRAAALRSSAFSLANTCSIGLNSGRIGRQVEQLCSRGFDLLADAGDLVRRQVVHHHDVTVAERRRQQLPDVGKEGGAGHRPVEDHGCGKPVDAQRGDQGRRLPMPMRDAGPAPLAPVCPAAQARHLRRSPSLVDEDEPGRIELGLRLEPGAPPGDYVRAVLLGGMRRLFFSVIFRRSKNRQSVLIATPTPRSRCSASRSSAKVMSDVAATLARRKPACASIRSDRRSPPCGCDAVRPISRQSRSQRNGARDADAEARRRPPPRRPVLDRPDHPDAQILG